MLGNTVVEFIFRSIVLVGERVIEFLDFVAIRRSGGLRPIKGWRNGCVTEGVGFLEKFKFVLRLTLKFLRACWTARRILPGRAKIMQI